MLSYLVQTQLQRGLLEHFHLVSLGAQESVDFHLLRLSDAMTPGLCLDVVLGVPVTERRDAVTEKRRGYVREEKRL